MVASPPPQARHFLGAAYSPVKGEGKSSATLFTHHKILKKLNEKVDRSNRLIKKNGETTKKGTNL